MTKPKPKCPECGAIFSTVQLVAMHRSRAHGVVGMSKSSVDKRRLDARKAAEAEAAKTTEAAALAAADQQKQTDEKTCTACGFVAKNARGMTVHMATTHRSDSSETKTKTPTGGSELEYVEKDQRSIERRAASQAKREAASDGIPEATLALALGRFQGLCASMALEFDLPPRRFASRLAELIFAAQVR